VCRMSPLDVEYEAPLGAGSSRLAQRRALTEI
jgi:hypothetical protein